MKKLYPYLVGVFAVAIVIALGFRTDQKVEAMEPSVLTSPNLVISQFQAGGGTANDEFVELHNISSSPVDLNGYRVVYRSSSGTNDVGPFATWSTSTIIPAGGYYLIASTSYDGGVTPDATYDPSVCLCSMSATAGGLAIRNGAQNTGVIIDAVGWGAATNIFFEGTRTAAPANNNSQARLLNGCKDTDNNADDFGATIPAAARDSATSANICSGGGETLFAALAANPTSLSPGATTLLTVTTIPATTPPSTGIAVVGNLTDIGGPASQTFFDDGTNGDVTAGDNVFSYLATVSADTTGGTHTVTAVASDAQGRSVNLQQGVTINAPRVGDDPLLLGNPSGATPDVANENNYLMPKVQYTLSYNRSKATPNWVAWHLDSSWIGSTPRQDDYRPDPSLPAGWYQVQTTDYNGAGYDRGHMCPSGDRTDTVDDNSATFLMTNFVPQLAANNQGPWEEFESYSRTLAGQGNELYIIDGPSGNAGTIAGGKIVVPQVTWKVVLILPNGTNDLHRVTKGTRAFGIIVPNQGNLDINTPWRNFRVTVDAVERLTGYNFFSAVPLSTQTIIEARHDNQ
ncbi:MAG TPA: DNA/RNA non-specific endonuclease [Pyrinomonadaceae bacterium]|nr:DNA/RNA non-specific endonuclease [Pyrinomonadaceae bacterium]